MLMVGNAPCPDSNFCLAHPADAPEPAGGWPCSHPSWDHGEYKSCGTCMHCSSFRHAEEETQMALWAIFASPLYISADPRPGRASSIPAASKRILLNRDVIAVSQDAAGRQGYRVSAGRGGLQVWKRELQGGAVAVAVHNGVDHPQAAPRLDFAQVGFSAVDRVAVRDLFLSADLGVHVVSVELDGQIASHGVIMLRLELASAHTEL